jgi:predicted secreted protein
VTLYELSADDDGRTVHAAPGDQIVVRLPETPGTGFRWELASPAPPEIILESTTFVPASGSSVGGSGTRTFTFVVKDRARARIGLQRWRPWEGERSIERSFAFEVNASDPG